MEIGKHINIQELFQGKENCTYQIFTQSPLKKTYDTKHDWKIYLKLISDKKLIVYIHSSYLINLCNETNIELLKKDLSVGKLLGCKGVVVHVGKHTTLMKEEGLLKMTKSIDKIVESIDESCPLLIETPAGQGTELLTTISDFVTFYKSLDKKKIKICIDTCHVFSLGYDPIDYCNYIELHCGKNAIKLIHLNDSKNVKGSRIDRHEKYGEGHIGKKNLDKVIVWAFENKIDIVREI